MEKQMTLAEAMLLGSAHMTPMAGVFQLNDWKFGCALGMMMFAHGKIDSMELYNKYPVFSVITRQATEIGDFDHTFFNDIASRFNKQVWAGTFKLEEFLDWLTARERELTAQITTAAADASREEPVPEEVTA